MKKNDVILTVSVLLYSFLFYNQSTGLNFLIFSIALVALSLITNRTLIKNKLWICASLGTILSGITVAYYGNTLSLVANLVSLSLLSAYSFSNSSLVFALFFSFYSYTSSLIFMFLDRIERRAKNVPDESTRSGKRVILILVSVLIAIIFFFMYRGSNALFNDFANRINLDFISMNWIAFTLGGVVLLYGFFHFRPISSLALYDQNSANIIFRQPISSSVIFGKQFTLADENFSGVLLFIMLNALLLIVNALDFNFLFIDGKLPAGLTYSEFVHQGTGMLITSIIAGVSIILFYFRGGMNFYEKSLLLKFLSYLWIIQNVCMLFSTSFRNNMYIAEYGLTYKRIGVYIYLGLTAIGLCVTLIKLSRAKSNMYLFRVNSWIFYALFIASCFFDWDNIITRFNMTEARQIEKKYLVDLSYSNLPQLYILRADSIHKRKEFTLVEESDQRNDQTPVSYDFETALNKKLFLFLHDTQARDWRSSQWLAKQTAHKLENAQVYNSVTVLNLSATELYSLEGIQNFHSLKKLNLYDNFLLSLKGLEQLNALEELDLGSNPIEDYSPLYKLNQLKTLRLPYNSREADKLKRLLPNTKIIQDA